MRKLILGAAGAIVFTLGLNAAAQTILVGQADTALNGGVYTTLAADDAAACAQFCANDALCMAWTYRAKPQSCELKAVIPQAVAETGATSGFARRAPEFARSLNDKAHETPAATTAPAPQATPPELSATDAHDMPVATAPPPHATLAPEDMLLGGPDSAGPALRGLEQPRG